MKNKLGGGQAIRYTPTSHLVLPSSYYNLSAICSTSAEARPYRGAAPILTAHCLLLPQHRFNPNMLYTSHFIDYIDPNNMHFKHMLRENHIIHTHLLYVIISIKIAYFLQSIPAKFDLTSFNQLLHFSPRNWERAPAGNFFAKAVHPKDSFFYGSE